MLDEVMKRLRPGQNPVSIARKQPDVGQYLLADHRLEVLFLNLLDALDDVVSARFESVDNRTRKRSRVGPKHQEHIRHLLGVDAHVRHWFRVPDVGELDAASADEWCASTIQCAVGGEQSVHLRGGRKG